MGWQNSSASSYYEQDEVDQGRQQQAEEPLLEQAHPPPHCHSTWQISLSRGGVAVVFVFWPVCSLGLVSWLVISK